LRDTKKSPIGAARKGQGEVLQCVNDTSTAKTDRICDFAAGRLSPRRAEGGLNGLQPVYQPAEERFWIAATRRGDERPA
jgi:hypothetical protein